jgi:NAD(P)-dependent dehydrogenase (short-subunit alcohol dehydrogenase family)
MRIVIVGATGTIGRAVLAALADRHEVIPVGKTRGDRRVDMESRDSIERLYSALGTVDAVVVAAGQARFGPLEKLADEDFRISLSSKLMGQVNLVRLGMGHVRDQGSFTLTSGVLANEPMPGSGAISLVNSGVEGFVRAAALEMPRGIRINAVSPPWVAETLAEMGRDPSGGMPAARVAAAYVESVEGKRSGQVLDARKF